MKIIGKFTTATLAAGLVLVTYGFICRAVNLNFFWESKSIGWALLLVGLIGFLSARVRLKKANKKKAVFEKIGIGVIGFILLVSKESSFEEATTHQPLPIFQFNRLEVFGLKRPDATFARPEASSLICRPSDWSTFRNLTLSRYCTIAQYMPYWPLLCNSVTQ